MEMTRYHFLLEQREQDLQTIDSLKENIQTKLIQLHQLMKKRGHTDHLQEEISSDSERITTLKKTLQQIDEELDQIGDDKEAHFEKIKNELITRIQELYPESTQEYQDILNNLSTSQHNKAEASQQLSLIHPFLSTLQMATTIKPQGNLLDFLRGKHPKSLLARLLHQAHGQAEKAYTHVEDGQMKHFLEKFVFEAKDPWNTTLQRKTFPALFKEFKELVSDLEHKNEEAHQQILHWEKALDTWILKYSTKQ